MQQQTQYVAPELKLAGEAGKVVLGSGIVGFDYAGEIMDPEQEFEADANLAAG
jgi:hypothetical protein